MTVQYPSGTVRRIVKEEKYLKICKAISRGQNVEEQIIHTLSKSNPEEVIKGASRIVGAEARTICKRNSGSQLQQKDYTDFMSFSWDKLNQELQVRAPHSLQIISAIVSDTPSQLNYVHTLCTVASALHSRSLQMSFLHYAVGFILTHGGCTNRVRVTLNYHNLHPDISSQYPMYTILIKIHVNSKHCPFGKVIFPLYLFHLMTFDIC